MESNKDTNKRMFHPAEFWKTKEIIGKAME
jgi:hypothetical protein